MWCLYDKLCRITCSKCLRSTAVLDMLWELSIYSESFINSVFIQGGKGLRMIKKPTSVLIWNTSTVYLLWNVQGYHISFINCHEIAQWKYVLPSFSFDGVTFRQRWYLISQKWVTNLMQHVRSQVNIGFIFISTRYWWCDWKKIVFLLNRAG